MDETHSTAHQVRTWEFFDRPAVVENSTYCVVLAGPDGKVVPGSRISKDFASLSAAFSARAGMLSQYPNAEVFNSKGLEADEA